MEIDPIKILQNTHSIKINNEHMSAAQAQQNSPVKEKGNSENVKNTSSIQSQKIKFQNQNKTDSVQRRNYTTTLCVSKKEYEAIVNKRPLIKFRPVVNSYIKSCDKALVAQSLSIPKSQIDRVIHETTQFLLYKNPASMYYDPNKILDDMYLDEDFKRLLLEKNITGYDGIRQQELLYYQEHGTILEPYVYRHGSKEQLLDYMKLQLSDAKTTLKNLYNILDTESGGLYSYFERPIHVLDNRTVQKMQKLVTDGLGNAKDRGYISEIEYNQNVEWALEKIYEIQSNTSLREALRIVTNHS
ncbi:MAG: hypothetical protein K6C94_08780 [Candidatus Gastranaerophilales bacterium]|nr:hypothetical protein [Candidatus Gastranaerophilales bacterium]